MKRKTVIGIADCSKFANYERWISDDPSIETIRLGYEQNNLYDLQKCDGVLLTGGEDVSPAFYNKPEYHNLCDADNMDPRRDQFELDMLKYIQQNHVPMLGICRGLQITNVFFGGTLIPDIPSTGKPHHSKIQEGEDRDHEIRINPFSILKNIAGTLTAEVNSAHHQAADIIGNELVATAFSGDGTVEALERRGGAEKPFMLLVQWHPERVKQIHNELSKKIRRFFLERAVIFGEQKDLKKENYENYQSLD